MSTKIFTNLFRQNIKYSKHVHLNALHRSVEKSQGYDKGGDEGKGKTNEEPFKDHLTIEAVGATEELSACIGLAREFIREDDKLKPLAEKLLKIQLVLVDIIEIVINHKVSEAETDKNVSPVTLSAAKVTKRDVEDLETLISHYGTLLPPVEKIIIPGGGKASASLHVAKAVCRRCERILITSFQGYDQEKEILKFINRLSAYLLQAARITAKFANRGEHVYKPGVKVDTVPDK